MLLARDEGQQKDITKYLANGTPQKAGASRGAGTKGRNYSRSPMRTQNETGGSQSSQAIYGVPKNEASQKFSQQSSLNSQQQTPVSGPTTPM